MLIVPEDEHGSGTRLNAMARALRTILHTPQTDRGTATPLAAPVGLARGGIAVMSRTSN
jgi:hypothetical protein